MDVTQPIMFAGELGTYIAQFLDLYGIPAIFISTVFLGENAILIAFILSSQGVFAYETVFIFAILGTLCADLFWYFVSISIPDKVLNGKLYSKIFNPVSAILSYFTKDRLFIALLFIKFLIGTRLLTIIYLARQKVALHLFIIFDTLGSAIFIAVLSIIGWLLGRGIYNLLPTYHFVTRLILIVLISVAVIYLLQTIVKKFLLSIGAKKNQAN